MVNRGEIKDREIASQIRDFSGLLFGTITPTDIDGFIDYQNKLMIFMETKHFGVSLPYGQKLALERLCDAVQKGGKEAIVFITTHCTDGDIDFALTSVNEYRWHYKWRKANGEYLVDCIKKLLNHLFKED